MKALRTMLLVLGLLLLASAFMIFAPHADAQTYLPGKPVSDTNPQPVKPLCWNGTAFAACASGGGGGGDASAANQTTQITRATEIRDRIGATTAPAAGSTNALLIDVKGLLAAPLTVGTHAVTQSGTWTVNTTSSTPSTGTPGSAAPAYAQQVAGAGPSGNLRALSTDTRGGLTPAQGLAASARTTLAASTATSISAAAASRIGLTVQVETALTANLFLCTTQATSCSATSYDALIPSGAGAGTTYTFLFAPSSALYAFTTGTPVVVANSWTAP
ncbi:MAG: hypothetical protein ABW128_07035 [Rhizorhabdus sp.]